MCWKSYDLVTLIVQENICRIVDLRSNLILRSLEYVHELQHLLFGLDDNSEIKVQIMEQNKDKEEIAQAEADRNTIEFVLGMCKNTNSVATCKRTYYDGYEVEVTARKQGVFASNEFTLEQFETIKSMATEMKAKAREEDQELYQDIIEKCNLNIVDLTHDDADE